MKDISVNKFLQDISAIIGGILPIAQLFIGQWISAFNKVFLANDLLTVTSIITLIVSYMLILAYLHNPFGELVIPTQKKRQLAMQEYWNERNRLELYLGSLLNTPGADKTVRKALNKLIDLKQPKPPIKIDPQNQAKVVVMIIVITAILFLALGVGRFSGPFINITQVVMYVLFVSFSALMLTIYKKNSDNNSRYIENVRMRANRAIKLAIDANEFGPLPQVTFMSQEETGPYNSGFKVVVSYKRKSYEIITDREAQYLQSVRKVVPNSDNQPL